MLRKLKAEPSPLYGVRFPLKTFRATFAQTAKDRHATIEAASLAMRHGWTETVERSYARIRADDASRELKDALGQSSRMQSVPEPRQARKWHSTPMSRI